MDVVIIATRGCSHCKNLTKELDDLGIEHRMVLVEDEPELCEKLAIRHSPNLVVDGKVVFREQMPRHELRKYFSNLNS